MPIKKMMLRTENGEVIGAVTLRLGKECEALFPSNFEPIALLVDETVTPAEAGERLSLPQDVREVSLLGTYREKRVFATTLSGQKAHFARWKLCLSVEQGEREAPTPKSPLNSLAPREEPTAPPMHDEAPTPPQEPQTTPCDDTKQKEEEEQPIAPVLSAKQDALSRAERLIEQGEPFRLFCDLMPLSRWALVPSEQCPYLVGIDGKGKDARVLYGVPGSRDYPPDEGTLWTFFPTSEDGGEGYYVTEYNDGNGE